MLRSRELKVHEYTAHTKDVVDRDTQHPGLDYFYVVDSDNDVEVIGPVEHGCSLFPDLTADLQQSWLAGFGS